MKKIFNLMNQRIQIVNKIQIMLLNQLVITKNKINNLILKLVYQMFQLHQAYQQKIPYKIKKIIQIQVNQKVNFN